MKKLLLALLGCSLLTLGAQAAQAGAAPKQTAAPQAKPTPAKTDQSVISEQLPSYPLDSCVVSGEKFSADEPPVNVVINGHLVRTCCRKCVREVKADPEHFIEKVKQAVIAQQKPLWPLTTCPVSGEHFGGEMGEPIDFVLGTRYVKMCCKDCIKEAKKDSAAFLKKLDAQLIPVLVKTYPRQTCPVSGEPLGEMGPPIDMMYGHRLVRLCCKSCVKKFKKRPAALVAKIYGPQPAGKKETK